MNYLFGPTWSKCYPSFVWGLTNRPQVTKGKSTPVGMGDIDRYHWHHIDIIFKESASDSGRLLMTKSFDQLPLLLQKWRKSRN